MIRTKKRAPRPTRILSKPLHQILHLLRLGGFAIGLLLLLFLFHLLTLGLPDPLTQKITAEARKKGLPIQVDSIHLSPHRGWVLQNVRLYSQSPDDLNPLFSAEKLYIFAWPDNWITPSETGWHISLHGKNSKVSLGSRWEASLPASNPFRIVNQLDASLYIHPNQFLLEDSELRWGGLRIHASGQLNIQNQPAKRSLPDFQTQVSRLFQTLETLRFSLEPEIDIRFHIDPAAPENNNIEASCFIPSDPGQLTATGSLNLGTQMAQLSITNSLRADDLLTLLPPRLQDNLARLELQPLGAVDFTAALGPAPAVQLFEQFRANMHNLQVRRNDLTLDPLAFEIVRNGDRLEVNKIQAGANDGTLTGTFKMDLSSRIWNSSLHAIALPGPVGTLVGSGLQMWIDRATFTNQPPDIHVNLSNRGPQGSIQMNGTFSAEDFT